MMAIFSTSTLHFATATSPVAGELNHPKCGVQGNYFYGKSGNKTQLDFHWHTPPAVRLKFDEDYKKIADLDYPKKQRGFVRLVKQLIDQDKQAAVGKNWDAVEDANKVRKIVDSGQIDWLGLENPTRDDTFAFDNEKQELIRLRGVMAKYKVPAPDAERALVLLSIPSKYGYLTSNKGRNLPMVRVDQMPAELHDAPEIFAKRDLERAAIRSKLRSKDDSRFREISERATQGIGLYTLLGPEIERLKRLYPKLSRQLDQFADDARKVDSINESRNKQMALNIFSQPGNGFVSLGNAHKRGVEKALQELCDSNNLNLSQTGVNSVSTTAD